MREGVGMGKLLAVMVVLALVSALGLANVVRAEGETKGDATAESDSIVPAVVGLPYLKAIEQIQKAGFFAQTPQAGGLAGKLTAVVKAQAPLPGTHAKRGTNVTVVVAGEESSAAVGTTGGGGR